jgi:prevent-host-death family protein
MPTVKIHAAKTQLSRLIERACKGEEIIIARGDLPVVRLQPIRVQSKLRKAGRFKGKFKVGPEFFDPLPDDELKAWQ